jgi:acetate kinase
VTLDEDANQATSDADVSAPGARVRTVVVTAAEDLEVSREVRRVLG